MGSYRRAKRTIEHLFRKWVLFGALVLGMLALSRPSDGQPIPRECDSIQDDRQNYWLCIGLQRSEGLLEEGKASEAISLLERLRQEQLLELRNYQPYRLLGRAYCKLGDKPAAQWHFDLYDCALAIDFKEQSCWISGRPEMGLRGDISPECTRIACGEAFLDEQSEDRQARYKTLKQSVENDRDVCGLPN